MKLKKLFLLSWGRAGVIIILEVAAIVLHNVVYGLTGIEEAFFFILAVLLLPIYFVVASIYTLVSKNKNDSSPEEGL